MLEKILKFLPIYFVFHVMRYSIALLQIPHSYARTFFIKPTETIINEYSANHKFIFIYASIEPAIGESSQNILSVVRELGGYIILVTNSSNYIFDKKTQKLIDVFIDNKNTGWDFSEYKRASQYIYRKLSVCSFAKIIYANDSVFYLPTKLKADISMLLANEYDAISLFDGLGRYNYHFASWCISISKEIFFDKKIQYFWNKFFEVKNKFYAIMEGEYAFSKTIFSLSPRTNVIYNGKLLCSLKEMNLDHLNYMSPKLHDDFFDSRNFMYGGNGLIRDPLNDFITHNLSEYPIPQTFAPLLLDFYDLPFIKKDIFWNDFQSISSIYFISSILDKKVSENYSNFMKAYFIKRGSLSRSKSLIKIINFLGIR